MLTVPDRFQRASILIVEDDTSTRSLITMALTKAGFKNIECAKDGIEGLDMTLALKPDLVILDIMMPRLDGLGYCQRVRNEPRAPRMPIIVQTVLEDRETRLGALSLGADDFVLKPLDPAELVLRARVHLERRFMLQDMNELCMCLRMELNQAQDMLQHFTASTLSATTQNRMNRHCEALEGLALMPGQINS